MFFLDSNFPDIRKARSEESDRYFSIWTKLRSNKKLRAGGFVRTEQMLTQMSTLAVQPILLGTIQFTRSTIVSRPVTQGLVEVISFTPKIIRVHLVNFCSNVIDRRGSIYCK